MNTQYTVDETRIVFEIFEHEAVLVDLDTGHYYVLDQSAGDIWRCMASGLGVPETVEALSRRYSADQDTLRRATEDFLKELIEEDLLQPADRASPVEGLSPPESAPSRLSFEAPSLFKYTEMENLILMDPIREVDESGWPKRRTFPKKRH